MKSETIPSSVTSIGNWAFSNCSELQSFVVDAANPVYKSVNGLLLTKDGRTLVAGVNGAVTIPSGVTSIGDMAFYGCSRLTSVTIPSGVTSIGSYAFYGCSGLTSVTIPSSVMSIGDEVFTSCSQLRSLSVSADNPYFLSDDGVLYDKQKTDLYFWPRQKRIELPASLRNVRAYACQYNYAMQGETLVFPSSVTNVGYDAFSSCQLGGIALNEGLLYSRPCKTPLPANRSMPTAVS